MHLTFMGATKTVTGSKYLISADNKRILVDCGLFQGFKEIRQRNWEKFPIDPKTINAVILTHAHLDHSGYLPVLIKNGFTGKIYCSPASLDLCSILLPDSGHLQEEEAMLANKYGYSRHKPALPLYTQEEAEKSLQYFKPINFGSTIKLGDNLTVSLSRAGHILGAALVEIKHHNTSILFSGDLGREHDQVMSAPTHIQNSDYLIIESTYGDRLHDPIDPLEQIEKIINRTIKRGGNIVIPAFAVGRAQLILYLLYQLKNAGRIPHIPIFLDSPMAVSSTKLLCKYGREHHIPRGECSKVSAIATYVNTPEESKALDKYETPVIIISASGMAEGGRVLHHLKRFLPDRRNTILFTGYQAAGTRGEALVNGKKEISIHGNIYPVHAEIVALSNLSAHADYREMLNWLSYFQQPPRKIFITHGEAVAAEALKRRIVERFGWHNCVIPEYLQKVELT